MSANYDLLSTPEWREDPHPPRQTHNPVLDLDDSQPSWDTWADDDDGDDNDDALLYTTRRHQRDDDGKILRRRSRQPWSPHIRDYAPLFVLAPVTGLMVLFALWQTNPRILRNTPQRAFEHTSPSLRKLLMFSLFTTMAVLVVVPSLCWYENARWRNKRA
jgi:hypothetical protein